MLWHPWGTSPQKQGVQQGDPLGHLLFSLVLQKIIDAIDADDECLHILFQAWCLDDGVLAGSKISYRWCSISSGLYWHFCYSSQM